MENRSSERLQALRGQSVALIRFALGISILLLHFRYPDGLLAGLVAALAILGGLSLIAGIYIRAGALLLVPSVLLISITGSDLAFSHLLLLVAGILFTILTAEIPHPLAEFPATSSKDTDSRTR